MADVLAGLTVLVVDEDVGFVFWLGEILTELGCSAVPALDCTQAVAITRALDFRINLVIVNSRLPGVSEMTKKLSCASRALKIVAIHDGNVGATSELQAQAILERPSGQARSHVRNG